MSIAENEAAALAALAGVADAAGPAVLKGFLANNAQLDAEWSQVVNEFGQGFRSPLPGRRDVTYILDSLRWLRDLQGRRAVVRRRLRAVDPGFAPSEPAPGEEIYSALLATTRAPEVKSWASQHWSALISDSLAAIARSEAFIASGEASVAAGARYDEHAPGLEAAHAAAATARDVLARIGYDPSQRAKQAVETLATMGGPSVVRDDARSALQALDRHEAATTANGLARAAEAAAAALSGTLAKIDGKSRLATATKAKLKEAKSAAAAAQAEALPQAEAALSALIEAAARGEESSINRLCDLARECPDAFAEGFASAFEGLRPTEAQLQGAFAVAVERL